MSPRPCPPCCPGASSRGHPRGMSGPSRWRALPSAGCCPGALGVRSVPRAGWVGLWWVSADAPSPRRHRAVCEPGRYFQLSFLSAAGEGEGAGPAYSQGSVCPVRSGRPPSLLPARTSPASEDAGTDRCSHALTRAFPRSDSTALGGSWPRPLLATRLWCHVHRAWAVLLSEAGPKRLGLGVQPVDWTLVPVHVLQKRLFLLIPAFSRDRRQRRVPSQVLCARGGLCPGGSLLLAWAQSRLPPQVQKAFP